MRGPGPAAVSWNRVMTDRLGPSVAAIGFASVIAAAGMMAHNVFEFGPWFLASPETLIPLAIYGLLALLAQSRPDSIVVLVALLGWALLNLVGGGILSVLPLGLFPFTPEQSLGHYGAHVVYAVAQVPLVLVAVVAIRIRLRPDASDDPG